MDAIAATAFISLASVAVSGGMLGFATNRLMKARDAFAKGRIDSLQTAERIAQLWKADQFTMIANRDQTVGEQEQVIETYRNELLKQIELNNQAAGTLRFAGDHVNGLNKALAGALETIRAKNTELAIDEETFAEIDLVLRKIFPQLPEEYEPAEAIETIFEAIVTSGYVVTYGGEENEKGVIARVIEKLAGEVEGLQEHSRLLEGEIEDREMKHEHLMSVLRERNGTISEQAEVISELREEKALAEQELEAVKSAANDDSSDADNYAKRLASSDALAVKLHALIVEKGLFFELSAKETGDLVEAGVRHDLRLNPLPEAGSVGTADQLAA